MADEKDEKFDEKEREKQDEKSEEKTWDEKWQRDPLTVVAWAAIFIWAGLVFLASNLGILDALLQGAAELTPYVCAVDKAVSERLGWGLSRSATLAAGCERCDFRFKKGGATCVEVPASLMAVAGP